MPAPMKACFCLALTLWVGDAIAANTLFVERSVFEITLVGPFDRIDSERDKAQEYPGTVSYKSAGEAVELDLKYTVRGNFRLQKRVCQHAQLWLDLKKNKVEGTLFEGQNKLKLVVQCRDRDTHEDYLALEEQVYRMFNLLSPISLRTRLVRVTYRDSESGGERTHLGFIIQHQKRLARELDMDVLEVPNLPIHDLDPHQSSLVALFMFLIANTDYSMIAGKPDEDCCHNTKPLVDAAGRVYAVPYDFDSTGYVSANYAQVSEGLGQRSIKDRVYRGFCVDDAILAANLATLRQQQSAILAIAGDSSIVSQRKAKQAVRLLERSFDIINDERRLQREVIRACR